MTEKEQENDQENKKEKSQSKKAQKPSARLLNYYSSVRDNTREELPDSIETESSESNDHSGAFAKLSEITSLDEHNLGLDSEVIQGTDEYNESRHVYETETPRNSSIDGFDAANNATTPDGRKRSRNSVVAGSRRPK